MEMQQNDHHLNLNRLCNLIIIMMWSRRLKNKVTIKILQIITVFLPRSIHSS